MPSKPWSWYSEGHRHWTVGKRPDGEVPPARCVSCGTTGQLLVWSVRLIPASSTTWGGPTPARAHGAARCLDAEACRVRYDAWYQRERERERLRRPDLPHDRAPTGSCRWCGEPIELEKSRKGWKRRRQRSYHRGDGWEAEGQPGDCLTRALAWRNPTQAAVQPCLERQGGRCEDCGYQLAQPVGGDDAWFDDQHGYGRYWRVEMPPYGLASERRSVEIDHRVPLWDGGDNHLENLRAICGRPCHRAKTAAEAAERARRRREAASDQLALTPAGE